MLAGRYTNGPNHPQQRPRVPDAVTLEHLCVEYGLIKDPAIQVSLMSLKVDPCDRQALEFVMEAVLEFESLQNAFPNPFREIAPTRFDNVDGSLVLGRTVNGTFYGIQPDALCRHLLIIGCTGSGKSHITKILVALLISGETQCR